MELWEVFEAGTVDAIIIDRTCLLGAGRPKGLMQSLMHLRRLLILNRLDLPHPAAPFTPAHALYMSAQQLGVNPGRCLVIDHDHRRARAARRLGFQAGVLLHSGGHAGWLLREGLLARQDLAAMDLWAIDALQDLPRALARLQRRHVP